MIFIFILLICINVVYNQENIVPNFEDHLICSNSPEGQSQVLLSGCLGSFNAHSKLTFTCQKIQHNCTQSTIMEYLLPLLNNKNISFNEINLFLQNQILTDISSLINTIQETQLDLESLNIDLSNQQQRENSIRELSLVNSFKSQKLRNVRLILKDNYFQTIQIKLDNLFQEQSLLQQLHLDLSSNDINDLKQSNFNIQQQTSLQQLYISLENNNKLNHNPQIVIPKKNKLIQLILNIDYKSQQQSEKKNYENSNVVLKFYDPYLIDFQINQTKHLEMQNCLFSNSQESLNSFNFLQTQEYLETLIVSYSTVLYPQLDLYKFNLAINQLDTSKNKLKKIEIKILNSLLSFQFQELYDLFRPLVYLSHLKIVLQNNKDLENNFLQFNTIISGLYSKLIDFSIQIDEKCDISNVNLRDLDQAFVFTSNRCVPKNCTDSICESCKEQFKNCKICQNFEECNQCEEGYYWKQNQCQKCPQNDCKLCYQYSQKEVSEVKQLEKCVLYKRREKFEYDSKIQCHSQYIEKKIGEQTFCIPQPDNCPEYCEECHPTDNTKCKSCKQPEQRSNNGYCTCNENFYMDGTRNFACIPCSQQQIDENCNMCLKQEGFSVIFNQKNQEENGVNIQCPGITQSETGNNPQSPISPKPHTKKEQETNHTLIIICSILGLCFLIILILGVLYYIRKKQQQQKQNQQQDRQGIQTDPRDQQNPGKKGEELQKPQAQQYDGIEIQIEVPGGNQNPNPQAQQQHGEGIQVEAPGDQNPRREEEKENQEEEEEKKNNQDPQNNPSPLQLPYNDPNTIVIYSENIKQCQSEYISEQEIQSFPSELIKEKKVTGKADGIQSEPQKTINNKFSNNSDIKKQGELLEKSPKRIMNMFQPTLSQTQTLYTFSSHDQNNKIETPITTNTNKKEEQTKPTQHTMGYLSNTNSDLLSQDQQNNKAIKLNIDVNQKSIEKQNKEQQSDKITVNKEIEVYQQKEEIQQQQQQQLQNNDLIQKQSDAKDSSCVIF